MGYLGTYRIDSLGRIILPKEFTKRYRWKAGDSLALWDKGGVIVLRPEPTYKPIKCALCRTRENKTFVEYAEICTTCMNEIDMEPR